MNAAPRLEMRGVSKTFPGVRALDDVTITVQDGEVLGVVGVNGAGKTTLMNVLGGIYQPEAGVIEIGGNITTLHRPIDAERAGIAFIHQELLNFPTLTVAENMLVTHLPESKILPFVTDKTAAFRRAQEVLDLLGTDISSRARMEDLSVGEKQVVEIARALATGASIVIFDEPSSSLSIKEKEALFSIVHRLRTEGKAVIYISHFLDEIMNLCDRYAVMRNGKLAGAGAVADVSKNEIIEMIVGKKVGKADLRHRKEIGPPLLEIVDIRSGNLLNGVSFTLNGGTVCGLWGLMGSGRTELIRAILGLDPMASGQLQIAIDGRLQPIAPKELLTRTGYVTESRRADGLFLDEPVWKNITATTLEEYARGRMRTLDKGAEISAARRYIDQMNIRTPGPTVPVANLSGGNQQKVVFSKWLARRPEILILDEPTRGVDVGAKREIGDLITSLADEGTAVLLITSEIEEMVALSDRVLVLRDGIIASSFEGKAITEANLMSAAMGDAGPDV